MKARIGFEVCWDAEANNVQTYGAYARFAAKSTSIDPDTFFLLVLFVRGRTTPQSKVGGEHIGVLDWQMFEKTLQHPSFGMGYWQSGVLVAFPYEHS